MNLKTILGWAAAAFMVWFIIEQPIAATHMVHNVGTFLATAVHNLSHFFGSI